MKRLRLAGKSLVLAAVCGGIGVSCTRPPPTPFIPGPVPRVESGPQAGEPALVKAPVKPGAVTRIDITTLFPLQQAGAVVVFDARPAIFYHMGHIPGARSWPHKRFDAQREAHESVLATAARSRIPVVLYCTDRECADARAVAERITALGYSVAVLEGGYAEWKAAGLPTQ